MKCPYCGAENFEGMNFCGECGGLLPRAQAQPPVNGLTRAGGFPSYNRGKVRTGYLVGGGLTAAIFFGLFYWASTFTYTERVWHEIYMGYGYWETVTRSIDPAIQALLLVVAIVGLMAMVFGTVSRK
jgi:hypothetical protein